MITLVNIAIIGAVAFCSASFSAFLDFCFEDGNIFDWYYNWLKKVCKIKADATGAIVGGSRWFKPLGGCLVCFNFYVSIPAFIWLCDLLHYGVLPMVLIFFLYQGLSGFFVQLIKRAYE